MGVPLFPAAQRGHEDEGPFLSPEGHSTHPKTLSRTQPELLLFSVRDPARKPGPAATEEAAGGRVCAWAQEYNTQ